MRKTDQMIIALAKNNYPSAAPVSLLLLLLQSLGHTNLQLGEAIRDDIYSTILLKKWKEITGSKLAEHTKPKAVKEGILTIEVDEANWMRVLNESESKLRDKINISLTSTFSSINSDQGKSYIRKIQLVLGKASKPCFKKGRFLAKTQDLDEKIFDKEEMRRIDQLVSPLVQHEQIRNAFYQVLIKFYHHRKNNSQKEQYINTKISH